MIAVPLYGDHDRIIGSLDVFSDKEGAFDKRDLRTLRVLAGFVAEAAAAQQRLERAAAVDPTLPKKARSAAMPEASGDTAVRDAANAFVGHTKVVPPK